MHHLEPPTCLSSPCLPYPDGHQCRESGRGVAFTAGHHFTPDSDTDLTALAEAATVSLSVILKVNKRCDFGLPTNATRGMAMALRLAGKIAFVNIGFDGPRITFTRVRGDYDKTMTGVRAFAAPGIPCRCRPPRSAPPSTPCCTSTR